MLRFVFRRLLVLIPVVLGISFLVFAILAMTPGDPARTILGANASNEAVTALREQMGLNDPFLIRYVRYMLGLLQGDLGVSWRTNYPVTEEFFHRVPITLTLALSSTLLMIVVALPIGILAAVKRNSLLDNASRGLSLLLTSIPGFWLGLLLILFFSLQLRWLPSRGVDSWQGYILPSVTASCALLAGLLRMTRSSMLGVIGEAYIRTARAQGVKEGRLLVRHALRNALLPIITVIGLNFGVLMGGAVITETVFSIPGIGALLISAVRNQDAPVVMAIVLFVAVVIGVVNLIVDVVYTYADPRLRSRRF